MGWIGKVLPGKTVTMSFGPLATDHLPLSPGPLNLGLKSMCSPST